MAGESVTATTKNITGASFEWTTEDSNITLEDDDTATVTIIPNTNIAGSATVSLTVTGTNTHTSASVSIPKTLAVTITIPGPGESPETAYSVADVIDAIDDAEGNTISNVYVTGLISEIGSYSSSYHSITYYISDDGTTSTQFEVYGGKNLNNTNFTSVDDIELQAEVIVFGNVLLYQSTTYEFAANNYLVSYIAPVKSLTGISSVTGSLTASVDDATWDATQLTIQGTVSNTGSTLVDISSYVNVTFDPSSPAAGVTSVDVTITPKTGSVPAKTFENISATVTEPKYVYDSVFTNELTSDSNTALSTSNWSTSVSGDAAELSATNTSYVYPGAYSTLKFGSSSKPGTLELEVPNNLEIKRVIIHAKAFSEADASNATLEVNSGSAQSIGAAYSYYVFDLETASDTVSIVSFSNTSSKKGRVYVDNMVFIANSKQDAIGAYGYAAEFMNALDEECSNLAVSTTTWGNLNTAWTTMGNANGEQTYFLSKTPSPRDGEGNTPTGDIIEKALARYDFIVGKYNKAQGLTAYTDFMSRNPSPIGSAKISLNIVVNNSPAIIAIVSVISLSAVAGFFLLRKRKEQ